MSRVISSAFKLYTKLKKIYCGRTWVYVNLGHQIGRIFLPAGPKRLPSLFCKLMIVIRVLISATWSLRQNGIIFNFFRGSHNRLLFGKLATVSVEGNRTFRISLLKPFALREAVADFGRRIVHAVLLDLLRRGQGHICHLSS